VSSLKGVRSVAIGGDQVRFSGFGCALEADGGVKCWGHVSDRFGGATPSVIPTSVVGVTGAQAIVAGANHACALLSNGEVTCWGGYGAAALGYGSTDFVTGPSAKVVGLEGVVALAVGGSQTCAILADTTVKCWGSPTGVQSPTMSATPLAIPDLSGVTALAISEEQMCALLDGGTVRCWDTVDIGNAGALYTPSAATMIDGVETAKALSGNCAVLGDATVACWSTQRTAQPLSGISGVKQLAADSIAGCALVKDGAVECWGANDVGQLGGDTHEGATDYPVYVLP